MPLVPAGVPGPPSPALAGSRGVGRSHLGCQEQHLPRSERSRARGKGACSGALQCSPFKQLLLNRSVGFPGSVASLPDRCTGFLPNLNSHEHMGVSLVQRHPLNCDVWMYWRLEEAGFILVWKTELGSRDGWGHPPPAEVLGKKRCFLLAAAPQQIPQGMCPCGSQGVLPWTETILVRKAALQFAFTTEPLSLLPPRNLLDAILSRAGWNSLQIAILSESTATSSNCASRKSMIDFFHFIF